MSRASRIIAVSVAIAAAAGGGFVAARPDLWPNKLKSMLVVGHADAQASGPVIYYQDPDGRLRYSLTPANTADGRAFRPVMASEDISFGEQEAEAAATPAAPEGRKIKFYRNPMGLPDTSPVPKRDSMGMPYIPVYEGDDTEDGSVKLSPGKLQRTGVKSEPAAPHVINTIIRAPGTIQLDERRSAVISMRSETWVQKVEDVTTGTQVHKGQPLMRGYSQAIAAAAAEYIAAGPLSDTNSLARGSKQRLLNLDVPETAIASIEKNRVSSLSIVWPAPRDGIVIERNVVEGMRAQPGDVLFRLADLSLVWSMVDVAERDLSALAIGQPVTVRARSYPGRTFSGKVSVIYPMINRETRTARVRIELSNPDLALLPDMYVDAEINTGSGKSVLAVPNSAVIDTGSRQVVFIDRGEGRLEPRDVKLGTHGNGYVEVRDGIQNGEPVVVSANFLIDAESNLRAALKGYSEAGPAP
jgi:Cu(I)/Ag(I) efflux system membrane fusion protein